MMKRVIIASKNLVKIDAVKIGFKKMFPFDSFQFESISVPSFVEDQPTDSETTIRGAVNRTRNAKSKL